MVSTAGLRGLGGALRVGLACLLAGYATLLFVYSPFTRALVNGSADGVPLGDFGSFFASGQAASQGLDPFGVYPLTMGASSGAAAANLNAPLSVVVFQALTPFDPATAREAWFVATLLAFVATLGLLLRAYPTSRGLLQVAWPFAAAAFWETIDLGQVYAFLALISTVAWLLLGRQRPVLAGVAIGFVVAFKPNFVVWPILLWLSGARRAAAASLAAATGFGLVPLALYGPRVYAEWFAAVRADAINPQVANASLAGLLTRLGAPPTVALAAAGIGLLALALWIWRRRPPAATTSALGLLGALLCSPLAWVGYGLFLLPIARGARTSWWLALGVALACLPRRPLQEWSDASALVRFTLGSAYTVAWAVLGANVVWAWASRHARPGLGMGAASESDGGL